MVKHIAKNKLLIIIIVILLSIGIFIYIQFFDGAHIFNDNNTDNVSLITEPPANPPEKIQALTFSKPSGFYNENIALDIVPLSDQYRVFYTTNSEIPTTASQQYNGSISINDLSSTDSKKDKITVIRAVAFDAENNLVDNKVFTMIYIINTTPFTQRYTMPVISLSTNKTNLFGTKGIITHPASKGREWERDVNVVFFESDGSVKFNVDAGIRMFGGATRNLQQKSFRITARKEYDVDNGKFKHIIFPNLKDYTGKIIDKFDSFILRNGGSDSSITDIRGSGLRDGLMNRLSTKLYIDNMAFRPAIVYLNGEYYGILNLRELEDENYISAHYNIPEDNVTIMSNGNVQENQLGVMLLDNGPLSEKTNYSSMIKFVSEKDMRIEANYLKASEYIDIDAFIKYMAFEIYIGNWDWPHNNVRVWRYNGTPNLQPFQDGKWRYILKDMDVGFGGFNTEPPSADTFSATVNGGGGSLKLGFMLRNLLKNKTFKDKFANCVCDMANYVMEPESVIEEINKAKLELEPEIDRMFRKYNRTNFLKSWGKTFITISDYAKKRPNYYLTSANAILKYNGLATVTINKSDKGSIIVNSMYLNSGSGSWTGRYFKNLPIYITATPNEGYSFSGFSIIGSGSISNNLLNISNDVTITADFR